MSDHSLSKFIPRLVTSEVRIDSGRGNLDFRRGSPDQVIKVTALRRGGERQEVASAVGWMGRSAIRNQSSFFIHDPVRADPVEVHSGEIGDPGFRRDDRRCSGGEGLFLRVISGIPCIVSTALA